MPPMQILLVEDNPADARLLREYLQDAGSDSYQILYVSRLADGIERLAAHPVDVILLDLGLPDSQGLDTFYRLHAAAPDLPVILLTGQQDNRAAALAVQAGAQDYLNKNEINQALLERTLRYAIERQHFLLTIQASEQRLRKIIEENSIAIFVLSLDGRILFANPAAGELFSRSVKDLLGVDFGYPVSIQQKAEITLVTPILSGDATTQREITAEMEATLTTWEGQSVYLVSLHDITARHAAEAEQHKTNERLSNILESISDGFFTLDAAMRITYYNRAAARLLGRPLSTVLGRPFTDAFPEMRNSVFEEKFTQALLTRATLDFEIHFTVAPLANWYNVRVYPHEEGISVYFQVTTERKSAEQAHQHELQLIQALSELYIPLISPDATLQDIAQEVLRRVCQLTGSSVGIITSTDQENDRKVQIVATLMERDGQLLSFEDGKLQVLIRDENGRFTGIWDVILNARQAFFVNNPREMGFLDTLPVNHIPIRQVLAVPVLLGERLVGQVTVANAGADYSERDLAGTRRLAEFYGLAIQRWEAENALRQARDESQRLFQAEHEQRELAETMRDGVALLVSAPDQQTIYQRLLEQVARVVPFDEAVIYLIEGEFIRAVHWFGFERFHSQGDQSLAVFRISDLPNLNLMMKTGQPVVNSDTYQHPDWVTLPKTEYIRSYAAVPILVQNQVIGFLNVHSVIPGLYNQAYLDLLRIFGNEVALALESARLFEETRHRLTELEVINKVSSSLRTAETLDEMLPVFVDGLLEVVRTDSGAIFLYNFATNELVLSLRRGLYENFTSPPLQPGEGIIGHVFQSGETYFSEEFIKDPMVFPGTLQQVPAGIGGLCMPLRTSHEIFGVMVLAMRTPRRPALDEVKLLEMLVDIAGNTFHRLRLFEETEVRLQYLSALRTIDLAIATSFDLRVTLNVLLEQILTQLSADAADILLYNPALKTLEHSASRGFYSRAIEQTVLQMGQGFAGQAALEGHSIFLADLRYRSVSYNRFNHLSGERFVSYMGVPLMTKGEIKGVLELFFRAPFQRTNEWDDFLDALARQAAIAIDNNQLFDNLQRSQMQLAMAYDSTLEGWANALDLRDHETEDHTRRVTEYTVELARRMGYTNDKDLLNIRRGSLLHDIGKMGVPDSILQKPDRLTEEEFATIREHPLIALKLLSPIAYLKPALDIPYCHHEHWDGSGYPRGLKGEQIPKPARIFFVVDVWDALSNERIYKKAWPMAEVLAYLRDQAGKQFDPEVVEEFIRMIEERTAEDPVPQSWPPEGVSAGTS